MRIYLKNSGPMRILLFICLTSFMVTSLMGFRDFKKEGVECKFEARIVDIEKPPPDQKVLVVKRILHTQAKVKEKQQKIYVLVTGETIIGSGDRILKFDDLHLELAIEIQGLKVIEKEDSEENIVVLAKRIRPLVE